MIKISFFMVIAFSGLFLQWLVESSRSTDMNLLLSSGPNFISSAFFGTLFSLWFYKGTYLASICFSVGIILYEILQLILPGRTFDVFDISASVLGMLVSCSILFFYRLVSSP